MLDLISRNIPSVHGLSKYGENFISFLEKFYEKKELGELPNREGIIVACKRMEEVHSGQVRRNGKPYIIHPYSVAKIYCLAHERKISTRGIIAAILHDNIEDAHKNSIVENYESIKNQFGVEDAVICEALSMPDGNLGLQEYLERFKSLVTLRTYIKELIIEKGESFTSDQIRALSFKIATIKICDRIHNLRTMEGFTIEGIERKIQETKEHFLPLAREIPKGNPKILEFLNEAIFAAEAQVIRKRSLKAI